MEEEIIDYHGTPLLKHECDVLLAFEEILGEKIPIVDEVKDDTFGFVILENHVIQLGLNEKDLTSLPENIGNLTNLEELYLSNNNITNIPESIGNLRNLRVLNIWHNPIRELPDEKSAQLSFGGKNIEYVKIHGKVYPVKSEFDGKHILDLSFLKLISISEIEDLNNLTKLEELNLSLNKITQIQGLETLTNLESLNLEENEITLIQGLETLINLESLNFEGNKITLIQGLETLTNLKSLNLRGNEITHIQGLEKVINLKDLNLRYNEIEKIEGLETLINLNQLDLSGNLIDQNTFNVNAQEVVKYCHDRLQIEGSSQKLKEHENTNVEKEIDLDEVDIQPNEQDELNVISKYEKESGKKARIKGGKYSAAFKKWMKDYTPETNKKNKNEIVDYHGTPLLRYEYDVLLTLEEILDKEIPIIDDFNHSGTYGFVVHKNHVVKLGLSRQTLKSLYLTSLPKSIGNLKALEYLDLTRNNLTSLPESIGNLISLKKLDLEFNHLTSLPDSIGCLKSLEQLNLRSTMLTSLPESIGNLTSLKYLELRYCDITSLPESIGNLRALEYLDIRSRRPTGRSGSISNSLPIRKCLRNLIENNCKIEKDYYTLIYEEDEQEVLYRKETRNDARIQSGALSSAFKKWKQKNEMRERMKEYQREEEEQRKKEEKKQKELDRIEEEKRKKQKEIDAQRIKQMSKQQKIDLCIKTWSKDELIDIVESAADSVFLTLKPGSLAEVTKKKLVNELFQQLTEAKISKLLLQELNAEGYIKITKEFMSKLEGEKKVTIGDKVFTLRNLYDLVKSNFDFVSYEDFKEEIKGESIDFDDPDPMEVSYLESALSNSNIISKRVLDALPSPEVEAYNSGDGGYEMSGLNTYSTQLSKKLTLVKIIDWMSNEVDYHEYTEEKCRINGFVIELSAMDDDKINLETKNCVIFGT